MTNEWLKRFYTGIVRSTNMVMFEQVVSLPARYKIKSPSVDDSFFCDADPQGDLWWINRRQVMVGGRVFDLQRSPAYSGPMGCYVFTVVV